MSGESGQFSNQQGAGLEGLAFRVLCSIGFRARSSGFRVLGSVVEAPGIQVYIGFIGLRAQVFSG